VVDILDYKEVVGSQFNSGLATIYRLDEIQKGLDHATVKQDIDLHYKLLLVYWKELYPIADKKDRRMHMDMWKAVSNNYKEIKREIKKNSNKINIELMNSFHYWEMELRDLQQKHGLGMPKKDDPRHSM